MFDGLFDFVPDVNGDGAHDLLDLAVVDDALRQEEKRRDLFRDDSDDLFDDGGDDFDDPTDDEWDD